MTLELVFKASPFDVQHHRDTVKNKLASLLAVPSRKSLSEIFHLGVVYRWPSTPKKQTTEYNAELRFLSHHFCFCRGVRI